MDLKEKTQFELVLENTQNIKHNNNIPPSKKQKIYKQKITALLLILF